MTQTALEALEDLNALTQPSVKQRADKLTERIRAALTAPVGLEWDERDLLLNRKIIIGSIKPWKIDGKWHWESPSAQEDSGIWFDTEEEARTDLEASAREWLTPSLNKKGHSDMTMTPLKAWNQIEYFYGKFLQENGLSKHIKALRQFFDASSESVGWSLSEDQYDGVRALIAGAFEAGATAVQENYEEMSDPDFTEAARDHAHSVTVDFLKLFPSVQFASPQTPTPDPAPDREAVAKAIYAVMRRKSGIVTGKGIEYPPEWVEGGNSQKQDEARDYADGVLALFPATPDPDTVTVRREDLPTEAMIAAGVKFALRAQVSSDRPWPDYIRDLYLTMQREGRP